MTLSQEVLYEALKAIANGVLTLEDVIGRKVERMTKKEVQEVVDSFTSEITEFNRNDLERDAYNFYGYAQSILSEVDMKLREEK